MRNQSYIEKAVRVVEVSPYPSKNDVDINTTITIKANTVLDVLSIESSVKLALSKDITPEELQNNYENIFDSLEQIECILTTSDNKSSIVLEPRTFLAVNTRYIILVNGLKDVFGNPQLEPYSSFFYTGTELILNGTELIFPEDKVILNEIPEFKWLKQNSTEYVFEISDSSSFENKIYSQTIRYENNESFANTIQITPEVILDEGTYYWRTRASTGVWSTTNAFYYQPINSVPVTKQDIVYQDAAVREYFQQSVFTDVTEDNISQYITNVADVIYLKLNKNISESEIRDIFLLSKKKDELGGTIEEEVDFDFCIVNSSSDEAYIAIYPIIK